MLVPILTRTSIRAAPVAARAAAVGASASASAARWQSTVAPAAPAPPAAGKQRKGTPSRRGAVSALAARKGKTPPHLMTLGDLSVEQVEQLVRDALTFKLMSKTFGPSAIRQTLSNRSVALIFSKRSTRTRVASETSVATLGGNAMFLGRDDIQLGVNETLEDSARVIGSMVDGIMARVGEHEEVETLAKYSPVPVVNALSVLYHPTQILADLLTLVEEYNGPFQVPEEVFNAPGATHSALRKWVNANVDVKGAVAGKKIAWIGDTNNIINEIIVTCPRLGMTCAIASPKGYNTVDPRVVAKLEEHGTAKDIIYTTEPSVALKDADIVVTDTWISMGQEDEKATRLAAFAGYQITNKMVDSAGANKDWKFLHCLPRKQEEVDDEVFYGPRSVVFPEAENRKWTIMAVFDAFYGRWSHA